MQALTRPPPKFSEMQGTKPVLVAVVHDVLNAETFDTIADLCDVVKTRAARLHIPYDATAMTAALTAVKHARPLVRPGDRR